MCKIKNCRRIITNDYMVLNKSGKGELPTNSTEIKNKINIKSLVGKSIRNPHRY